MALPDVKYFTEASVAAARMFERIGREALIDGENTKGSVLDKISGEIVFDNIRFTYSSRPDSVVLRDFNLRVEAGETVALVGASGSGKSTAVALLQRFYDPDEGAVKIDGIDIRTLQLKWLRSKMGLVSQEHALFGASIRENIMFGKLDATMEEITGAAMAVNAHDFIRQLPDGYETKVRLIRFFSLASRTKIVNMFSSGRTGRRTRSILVGRAETKNRYSSSYHKESGDTAARRSHERARLGIGEACPKCARSGIDGEDDAGKLLFYLISQK